MSPAVMVRPQSVNILLRVIYFIFVGWWLTAIVSAFAWFLNVTIIGLPLGLWLINRLPAIATLRPQGGEWIVQGNMLHYQRQVQRPLWQRALYFVLVGWWFSGIWIALAYFALVTVIGLPLSFWMYGRIGAVTTLYRM